MLAQYGISDPGEEIVQKAIQEGLKIVPIPGACALINAIIASGLSTKEFLFLGFLSSNTKEKKQKLEENKYEQKTIILYEAPHKLIDTLNAILEVLGNRKIVLARELTKIHEEYIRGVVEEVIQKVSEPKGEFVIIIEGAQKSKKQEEIEDLSKLSLEDHYKYYENKGLLKKDIIKQIAKDRKQTKNEVYKYFL